MVAAPAPSPIRPLNESRNCYARHEPLRSSASPTIRGDRAMRGCLGAPASTATGSFPSTRPWLYGRAFVQSPIWTTSPTCWGRANRVDIVDVFRQPEHVAAIVDDCIRLHIPALWLQLGVDDARNTAQAAGGDGGHGSLYQSGTPADGLTYSSRMNLRGLLFH